jgi:hypothetical protein
MSPLEGRRRPPCVRGYSSTEGILADAATEELGSEAAAWKRRGNFELSRRFRAMFFVISVAAKLKEVL